MESSNWKSARLNAVNGSNNSPTTHMPNNTINISFDILGLQIHGHQYRLVPVPGDERHHLLNRGHLLPLEAGTEPAAGVEFPDGRQGKISHPALAVGGSVEGVIMDADQLAILGAAGVDARDPKLGSAPLVGRHQASAFGAEAIGADDAVGRGRDASSS